LIRARKHTAEYRVCISDDRHRPPGGIVTARSIICRLMT
jgi:hypothetical protein